MKLVPPAHAFIRRIARALRTEARARVRSGAWVAMALLAISPAAAAERSAPALNWSLPLFSSEGFRTMTARGSEARAVDSHRIDVVDLSLTLFSGDAASRVDTVLLSPAATFLPDAKTARGEKSVRYIGEDIEATGTRWIYRHDEKKISLDGSVRVTFHAELKNLLQ